jgi:hypothetical protein
MATPRQTPTGIERETPASGTDERETPNPDPHPRSGDHSTQVFPPREGTPNPDLPGGVEDVPKQEL